MSAICVGCDRYADDMPEYTETDPVVNDGTYADHKFVCTTCYMFLIDVGRDSGSPHQIQEAAISLVRPLNNLT